jgi:hypothetical protein
MLIRPGSKWPAVRESHWLGGVPLHGVDHALVVLEPFVRVQLAVGPQSSQASTGIYELRCEVEPCFVLFNEAPGRELVEAWRRVLESPDVEEHGRPEVAFVLQSPLPDGARADHADLQRRRLVAAREIHTHQVDTPPAVPGIRERDPPRPHGEGVLGKGVIHARVFPQSFGAVIRTRRAWLGWLAMIPVPPLIEDPLTGGAVSTVHEMFASSDEQEMQAILREVDELRRARGRQQLGPWWQIQDHGLFCTRRFSRAHVWPRCPEEPTESTQ